MFSGKGAREASAMALTQAVLAGHEDALPEMFVRGSGFYGVQLNAENPIGTMQSIEHALRALDKSMREETERFAHSEQVLADFQAQLGKPFEHEARLKELVFKQAALNAAHLDKGERQVAPEEAGDQDRSDDPPAPVRSTADRTAWQAREAPRRRQRVYKAPTLRPGL